MHGQILKQIGPWSNLTPLNASAMTTKYAYDDGDGSVDNDITDDKFLVRIDYPDLSFEAWTYNPSTPRADQPTTWRDREGRVTTYTYDAVSQYAKSETVRNASGNLMSDAFRSKANFRMSSM